MTTREEAIAEAAKHLSKAIVVLYTYPLEEAARQAHVPGGPSVEELVVTIGRRRQEKNLAAAGSRAVVVDAEVRTGPKAVEAIGSNRPPRSNQGPVLRTEAAAEYCGMSPKTLRNLKSLGTGPQAYKQGRLTVYFPPDLDRWLRGRLRPA